MDRRLTRGELVLDALRSDILNGQIAPGTQLTFADLTKRYGASTGVLREVLPRLVEQRLVTSRPQLGYRVVPVSIADLEDLTEARVVIETMVFDRSIQHGDLDWESRVVAVHHRLSQLPALAEDGNINITWLDTHRQFHAVLLEGCPSRRLQEVAQSLRDLSEVYRCWSVRSTEHLHLRDFEHERIATLAVQRDAAGACDALRSHIEKTTELLISAQKDRLSSSEMQAS
jgi:DNA-binding GntR family transcriptional regulator